MGRSTSILPLLAAALLALAGGAGPARGLTESGAEAAAGVAPWSPAEPVVPAADPADELLLDEEFEDDPLFDEDLVSESGRRDPLEGWNRGIFRFNRGMDVVLFDPITRGYQFLVPPAGRRAVYRMFLNLDTPVVLANQILQVRIGDAAGTLGRFVINSTAGAVGLFDPAAEAAGIQRTTGDFGQTLARYGTPSGPYLVLPIFGPSTARDALGNIVDIMADPISYFLGPFQWWTLVLGGGEGLASREAHVGDLSALEEGSVDFYSALRSAYLQSRAAAVRHARGEGAPSDVVVLSGD